MPKSRLLIFSGPSGVGKTDLIMRLLEENTHMKHAISHTTRAPRANEVSRVHYHFVNRREFEHLAEMGQFADYREIHGNYYGLSMAAISEITDAGYHAITDVDVKGAKVIKGKIPSAYTFFLIPHKLEELNDRVKLRGGLTQEEQAMRMQRVQMEMLSAEQFDFQLRGSSTRQIAEELRNLLGDEFCPSI